MIANIIGHLRLCYQLVRFWVLVSFGRGIHSSRRSRKCHVALMNFGRSFPIEHTDPLKSLRGFANLKLALDLREC
jgi:hypothetical protein